MDQSYNEGYTSPEGDLGQDIEFDFDDDEFEDNADLIRILGIAGGVAALLGGLMLLLSRRRRRTPMEQVLDQVTNTGKDVRKAVEHADLGALLGDALDQVNSRVRSVDVQDLTRGVRHAVRDAARGAQKGAGQIDLEGAINEIQQRLSTIEREGFRGARRAQKEARRAFRNLDLGNLPDDARQELADVWDEISKRARSVGWEQAVDESRKNLRRLSRNLSGGSGLLGTVLAALGSQLGNVRDRLQNDVLPGVQGTVQDDLLPEARKRARQAGETLASVAGDARKRGGDLVDEYGPQVAKSAGQAADSAKGFGFQVGDFLRGIAVEALDRMMSDVLPGARKGGQQVADTVRNDTFPWIRHRAGEVRDRIQDDVAPRVGEMAAQAPGMVRDAVGVAGPAVGDALSSVATAVGDAVSRARPKVGDAVEGGRAKVEEAVKGGSSGIGSALSTAGSRAGDAVGAAVGTTKYVTGETSRILFWLSMLSGLILVIFVPDPERQKEIWHNVQGFLGEIRNMWGDLGPDEFEAGPDQDYTGDAGV